MLNKKTKLKLTDFECNLLINGMNEFDNFKAGDWIAADASVCIIYYSAK